MTSNIHKTTVDFINEIAQLKADLAKVTAQRDAAQAERNDRDTEASLLFESLQDMNGRYANKARQVHDLQLKVKEYEQDKAVLYECFQEAQAAANMWQAKHQEAQQAREELREALAEVETQIEALRAENSALNERVHELECLEAADARHIDVLVAALVEERDANEALYCQVADLQTSVNLASAVTIKLKERLTEATMLKERAEAENVYYQGIAQNERDSALYWYRKAAQNANL